MDAVERAFRSKDAAAIDKAGAAFRAIRKPLVEWYTIQEIDDPDFQPTPEIQAIMLRDRALLEALVARDNEENAAREIAYRERQVARDTAEAMPMPRAIKKRKLTQQLVFQGADALSKASRIWGAVKTNHNESEYLEVMAPLIECALAGEGGDYEAARAWIPTGFNRWRRTMQTFGDELRSLATDRSPGNRQRWVDACKRIGRSLNAEALEEFQRAVKNSAIREEVQ